MKNRRDFDGMKRESAQSVPAAGDEMKGAHAGHAAWRIELFGPVRAVQEDRILSRFRTRKAALILAYFALHPGRRFPRERLVDLFWPEADLPAGLVSLSTALTTLRRELEPQGAPPGSVLIADRQTVGLNPAAFTSDVGEFQELLRLAEGVDAASRAALLERATGLYQGELLEGFYEDWAVAEQGRWRERYAEALADWSAALEETGDLKGALEAVKRVSQAEPYREEAYRTQMRLLGAMGRTGAALELYRELEQLLRRDMDIAPSRETQDMAERLRLGLDSPPQDSSPQDSPWEPPRPQVSVNSVAPLPDPMTPFFGRGDELDELETLLLHSGNRLVTLIGPAGSGKTRLAIEAARRLSGSFAGEIAFASLAELSDPRLLPEMILTALRQPLASSREPFEQAVERLSVGPFVLILDNFEQLVGEGARIVRRFLERAPELKCLVTSQQVLGLTGEREFHVRPLPTPREDGAPDRLMESESVQLFVDRAQAVDAGFRVTPSNAPAVAELCRRLEGLPLALELAAARARVLTPEQMLAQLSHRFDLLVSRKRDVEPRHRTLRSAVDWSYGLLTPELQQFFARLTVFGGSWSLAEAELILEEPLALEFLEQLRAYSLVETETVERSLNFRLEERPMGVKWDHGPVEWGLRGRWEAMGVDPAQSEKRFRLLMTLRDYGEERLAAEGDAEPLKWRLLHYCRAVADYSVWGIDHERLYIDHGEAIFRWYDQFQDNVRAALGWALENCPVEALRLSVQMQNFWYFHGRWREGGEWLACALERAGHDDVPWRISALWVAGSFAESQGDYPAADEYYNELLALGRPLLAREVILSAEGRERFVCTVGAALVMQGEIARRQGRYEAAREYYEESLPFWEELKDDHGAARLDGRLGDLALAQGRYKEARTLFERCRDYWLALDFSRHERDRALTLRRLGEIELLQGNLPAAEEYLRQSLAIFRATQDNRNIAETSLNWGDLALTQGNTGAAVAAYRESLEIWRDLGSRAEVADALAGLAKAATVEGAWERGMRLFGASDAIHRSLGIPVPLNEREEHDRRVSEAGSALGETVFAKAWSEGAMLPMTGAIAYALEQDA